MIKTLFVSFVAKAAALAADTELAPSGRGTHFAQLLPLAPETAGCSASFFYSLQLGEAAPISTEAYVTQHSGSLLRCAPLRARSLFPAGPALWVSDSLCAAGVFI